MTASRGCRIMQTATVARLGLTVLVIVGGAGFLVMSSVGEAKHYMMVNELIDGGLDHWSDKVLEVNGVVAAGSLIETVIDQETQRSFVLERGGKRIRVFNGGPKPDTFSDMVEVVATGHLVPAARMQDQATALCKHTHAGCPIHSDAEQAWVVDATDVTAKCPDHYDGAPSIKPTYR
jgi:cytochrome c-type biogenesis protein CcmE